MTSIPRVRGLPAGGPWRVLEECTATAHNTLNAARYRTVRPPCICPRAKVLLAARRAKERTDYARPAEHRATSRAVTLPMMTPAPVTRDTPNFRGGLCTTEEGVRVADAGMSMEVSLRGIAARELAKTQCRSCPLKDSTCLPWVLGQESPAGSWGGVWGGLDPWNRRGRQMVFEDGTPKLVSYVSVV